MRAWDVLCLCLLLTWGGGARVDVRYFLFPFRSPGVCLGVNMASRG